MQSNIRKAFDKALISIPDGLGKANTAFEGVQFTPKANIPYQVVRLLPLPVENPTFNDNYHREVGYYQVVLCYPKGKGVGEAAAMADKIKAYFKRGLTIQEDTDIVIVQDTPSINPFYINGDRLEVIVRIKYYCEQFEGV